ncbi:MAG: peptide-N-glycosidase F-related protein [Acidobacteriota bacterium]
MYYGKRAKSYDFTKDVGLALSTSMTGLELNVNWYFAVVAIDANGNESAFSNEYIDAVAGRVKLRAHNDDYLCWGASKCVPNSPDKVQRSDGWQLNVPVDFPVGDWKKITVTYTIDSRLCKAGQNGTTDKCGGTNPGGYNTCGDPWDRIANLYLVLDESCLSNGASCINNNQLELMRAITPFGTDAPAPLGDGRVGPRVLTMDVTPFKSLLTGRKYVGAEIGHFVQAGWHVTVDFNFSKRPDEASPKKPADGVTIVGYGGAPLPTRSVAVPASATKVYMRVFTSGHGGTQYCDGGTNNGASCTSNANCPGGSCQNCDEFCHRTNRILRNTTPIWQQVPFRTDCSPAGLFDCQNWNACGWPSCTFSRAAWCPGYIACHTNAPCDQDIDLTSQLPAGGTYNIDYDVLVNRGSWSVSLVMFWYNN